VGLFAQDQFMPGTTGNGLLFGGELKLFLAQLAGVVSVGIFVFLSSLIFWNVIKATVGLRVPPEEEMEGLDIGEHGIMAYPEFQAPGEGFRGGLVGASQAMMATPQRRLVAGVAEKS
jgi:Amt family ammonium transporter